MLALLLLGCGPATFGTDESAADGRAVETVGDGPADTGDRVEAEFFDDTFVHEVAITLETDAARSLQRNPYDYAEGSVTVDGAEFARVGVRLRGKYGSFRDLDGKPKFKLDFNRFEKDQRLGDHETLALNNEVVDCSYLREPVGYALWRQLGLPAPRTVYTRVTVNGEDYGLYVAVEFPDDRFLADRYADGSGNLYDGKYVYSERGDFALIDFTPEQVDYFQLEEGTDVGRADLYGIRDALSADGTFEERFGPVLDTARFRRHLAAEQWTGHLDGYAMNTNNYRVYFDPADGLADLLVYDLDYAFLSPGTWGMSWASPTGALVKECWADEGCRAEHAAAVADVVESVDTDALLAEVDRWTALIAGDVESDPKRECTRRQIAPEQAAIRAWVEGGSADLAAYWSVGG